MRAAASDAAAFLCEGFCHRVEVEGRDIHITYKQANVSLTTLEKKKLLELIFLRVKRGALVSCRGKSSYI